jgi:hypothetical protein
MFDHIPARVTSKLGADHIAWLCSDGRGADHAESRASGAWDCNDVESYAAYNVLADALRVGPEFVGHRGGWGGDWYRWYCSTALPVPPDGYDPTGERRAAWWGLVSVEDQARAAAPPVVGHP